MPSYPRPSHLPGLLSSSPPKIRALVSIPIPRPVSPLPKLPSPTRAPSFGSTWRRSTHLIPAVVPRTTADIPLPPNPPPSGPNRSEIIETVTSTIQEAQRNHNFSQPAELQRSRKQLWHCINRYVDTEPAPTKTPLTLFVAHPNGLPKETWEPTLLAFIKQLKDRHSSLFSVQEIWTWEAVNHGDSALVNAGNLGGLYDWYDNTRDILNFLWHYLPENPSAGREWPLHLPILPSSISTLRKKSGFASRTLVSIGHSLGGGTTALAAYNAPQLFSTLILVDPIIESRDEYDRSPLPYGAVKRRSHWPSRDTAFESLKNNPFFAAWHPDVLELFVDHGMHPSPLGGVELKMSGVVEATVFADFWTCDQVFKALPYLDERIDVRWIMPSIEGTWFKFDFDGSFAQRRVWRRPANSSNVILPGVGHLIAQEAPDQLGYEIWSYLQQRYGDGMVEAKARL